MIAIKIGVKSMEYQTERRMEIPTWARIQPRYWGCLTIEYTPVVSNLFGVQWVSATSSLTAFTPLMAIQAPSIISGREIIEWRMGVEKFAIEMDKFEIIGMVNLGWGEIQSPTKNIDSIVPEIVP